MKNIVERIDIEGALCPVIGGLNTFIKCIEGYSDLGGALRPDKGGLNVLINGIIGYIDLGGLHARR
jgi:hypothetical protein